MYAMTAAHKSLPLPTYVEVKNLNNGRKIIVRVNDRGPFHRGRIIDLSYAAAHKLGMLGRGTARVEVRAIDARQWIARNKRNSNVHVASVEKANPSRVVSSDSLKLQMGAFSNKQNAHAFVDSIKYKFDHPIKVHEVEKRLEKTI